MGTYFSFTLLLLICTGYMIDSISAVGLSPRPTNRKKLKKEEHMESHPEHGKYLDTFSFKKPWVSDTGKNVVLNWEFLGSSISAQENHVRLTSAKKGQQGMIRSNWNLGMIVTFRYGGGSRIGGDGMAIWLTKKPALGPVFGGADKWEGLAIFIDTYDNDNQRDNPMISAWYNDGSLSYDHKTDGLMGQIEGCIPTNWNRNPYTNSKLKIVHEGGKIDIYIYDSTSTKTVKYYPCVIGIPLNLVDDEHFLAFSSQTSDFTDNHDIFSVKVFNLDADADSDSPNFEEEVIPQTDEKSFIVEEVKKRITEMDKHTPDEKKQAIPVSEGVNSILHIKKEEPTKPKTIEGELRQMTDQQQEMIESLIHVANNFRAVTEENARKVEKVRAISLEVGEMLKSINSNVLTKDDLRPPTATHNEFDVEYIKSEIGQMMVDFEDKLTISRDRAATSFEIINRMLAHLQKDQDSHDENLIHYFINQNTAVSKINEQHGFGTWTYILIVQVIIALVMFLPYWRKKSYTPYFFDEKIRV